MRKGWREAWVWLELVLVGTLATAAPARALGEGPVRLTVEVRWGPSDLPELPGAEGGPEVELSVAEGRVIEARAWPPSGDSAEPEPRADGAWWIGSGPSGRVRARLEAAIGASLIVRAGDQVTRLPILALLEGPQQTVPQAPIEVAVERLPWDALEIEGGEGSAAPGSAAPGSLVPLTLGFNILMPVATQANVRFSADLRPIRGGAPVWELAPQRRLVATNQAESPELLVNVPMPRSEGTYLLEFRADWEPAAGEGTRLGRWLRRRRGGVGLTAARRRVSLVVVGPRAPAALPGEGTVVDALDLSARTRGHRPSVSGRSPPVVTGRTAWSVPEQALLEPGRRDRLRGWIARGGPESATLGPVDGSGLAWSAFGLRVPRPGRPHRLSLTIQGGHPEALGVALVVPGGPGVRPRVLLDACASGPAVPEGGRPLTVSWPVWPDAAEPVLVLVNRDGRTPVRLGNVELAELPGEPMPAPLSETHPEAARVLALHLAGPGDLDRFGGAVDGVPARDALAGGDHLAAYLVHCGASAAVLPDDLADRAARQALNGQAAEDAVGPDRLDLTLRLLARRGLSAWLEADCAGPLPGLPEPNAPEALARGLVRVDPRGQPDGLVYQPLNPEVGTALKRRVVEAIAPRGTHPNLNGLLIRLGPGSTLPGSPGTGLDDQTYARFVASAFAPADARQVPGLAANDPGRFKARQRFLDGAGHNAWLEWRAEQIGALYTELALALGQAAPGAVLALATPGLDDGPAGLEARRADRSGQPPPSAWRAVGLDLERWPTVEGGPAILRRVGLTTGDLGHDLGTSPELDAAVAARPARGLLLGVEDRPTAPAQALRLVASPLAEGPAGDEPLGHALAVLDPRWVILDGRAVAGQEARLARLARIYRALPAPAEVGPPLPCSKSGVAVRSWTHAGRTYLALANDTPYEVLQETVLKLPEGAVVDDLGRGLRLEPAAAPGGGKRLVLKLEPFGIAAVRIGASAVEAEPVPPYLPALPALNAQVEALLTRLGRIAQRDGASGPPCPGFEPPANGRDPTAAEIKTTARVAAAVRGWAAVGDPANTVELDPSRPHAGRASLRLDARKRPATVASDAFPAPGGGRVTVRAWLRADRAEAPVRVRVEAEAGGRPVVREEIVTARADWTEARMTLNDLPPGGLDRLMLRFEWLGPAPGALWVDDVSLAGAAPSESGRRAQQVLAAALHAYRERRYADFARLVGSHWARPFGSESQPELAGTGPDRDGPIRTGDASDLPPNRRLR